METFVKPFTTRPDRTPRAANPRARRVTNTHPLIGHQTYPTAKDNLLREMGFAMDWRHRAVCLDEDPELFFPIGNTGPAIMQIEEAKQVCRRCDVREQCLAWALEAGQDHGVWGGLSEDERRALKRRNARARIRTA